MIGLPANLHPSMQQGQATETEPPRKISNSLTSTSASLTYLGKGSLLMWPREGVSG